MCCTLYIAEKGNMPTYKNSKIANFTDSTAVTNRSKDSSEPFERLLEHLKVEGTVQWLQKQNQSSKVYNCRLHAKIKTHIP